VSRLTGRRQPHAQERQFHKPELTFPGAEVEMVFSKARQNLANMRNVVPAAKTENEYVVQITDGER
jgi:hypothetical protein